ncbi:MAG TPA: cyclic nucleotide-binding domain-containing protein, partial [Advenella sp.]|nr:cyclic nucleotide-binding domain-containing protein [Advenella sp.]
LAIISNREEELFFDSLKKQLIPWQAAQTLLSNAENLGDAARAGGARAYTRALRHDIRYTNAFKIALRLQTTFNFSPWLAHELSQRIIKLISKHSVVSQLVRFCRDDLTPLLGQEIAGKAERILLARLHTIDNALSALNLTYPVYAHWTQEDYLARIARSLEVTRYNDMLEQSLVTKEVYNNLIAQVNLRWEPLFRHPSLDVSLSAKELVKRVPLFEDMDDSALTQLSRLLRPRLMLPNQPVPQVDRYGHKLMFFVASGAVLITLPDGSRVELGSGEMLGELSMLTDKTLTQSVRSMGYSKLLFLQARDFHALMKKFPDIKEKIDLVVKHRLRALEVWEQYAAKSANATDGMDESETAAAPGGISSRSQEELQDPAAMSEPVQPDTREPEQPDSDHHVIEKN